MQVKNDQWAQHLVRFQFNSNSFFSLSLSPSLTNQKKNVLSLTIWKRLHQKTPFSLGKIATHQRTLLVNRKKTMTGITVRRSGRGKKRKKIEERRERVKHCWKSSFSTGASYERQKKLQNRTCNSRLRLGQQQQQKTWPPTIESHYEWSTKMNSSTLPWCFWNLLEHALPPKVTSNFSLLLNNHCTGARWFSLLSGWIESKHKRMREPKMKKAFFFFLLQCFSMFNIESIQLLIFLLSSLSLSLPIFSLFSILLPLSLSLSSGERKFSLSIWFTIFVCFFLFIENIHNFKCFDSFHWFIDRYTICIGKTVSFSHCVLFCSLLFFHFLPFFFLFILALTHNDSTFECTKSSVSRQVNCDRFSFWRFQQAIISLPLTFTFLRFIFFYTRPPASIAPPWGVCKATVNKKRVYS